ncbi:MAG: undecaprenyl/decaprenyl-phosphate alpha-N-acetylglucosaminyl 1-phosphate transferase [Candidatus Omnitrophica bacterium]|nr:undecaprenyl/decaprenyl-phosphate alpha-N-acetylglucosaminyl 1-phosphate transferase [Candidatus Omnitrophota bacterium]
MTMPMELLTGLALATAAVAGSVLTIIARALAVRWALLDEPVKGKLHRVATPRLGGVAIFLAYLAGVLWSWPWSRGEQVILLGGLVTFLIGLMDDLVRLPAFIKLAALALVTLALAHTGVVIHVVPHWELLNTVITLLWIVGVASAYNAMDNMNGLAAGIAVIASGIYVAVALQTYQTQWAIFAAALAGASLGFWYHNFRTGSIFMGDSGSFFLGFSLAVLGVMGGWSANPVKAWLVPILVLGVPLADLVYTVFLLKRSGTVRSWRGAIAYSGQVHLSHRLVRLGFSQAGAVLFIYLICLTVSLGALVLRGTTTMQTLLLLLQFCLILLLIGVLMQMTKRAARSRPPV